MDYTVTGLIKSKKIKDRFYAEFDSGEKLTITINHIADFGIYTGKSFSEEEFESLRESAGDTQLKSRALRILGSRNMSRGELIARLTQKGEDPVKTEETADWLEKIGALDDREYAGLIVRHYAAKGYGLAKIKEELYRRKIPEELRSEALQEAPESGERPYELLQNRLRGREMSREEIGKAANYLYRRGFSWDEIKSAVNRLESETED